MGDPAPNFLTDLRSSWEPSTCPGQGLWRLLCSRQGWKTELNMLCLFYSTEREGPGRWTTPASGGIVKGLGKGGFSPVWGVQGHLLAKVVRLVP